MPGRRLVKSHQKRSAGLKNHLRVLRLVVYQCLPELMIDQVHLPRVVQRRFEDISDLMLLVEL